jgi:hypothetical protein
VDIWDGDDGEPIVFHGHTLTTKISLRNVLETIHQYAFKTSQYPIILSIENHCSLEQQKQMASLMIEILGGNQSIIQTKSISIHNLKIIL